MFIEIQRGRSFKGTALYCLHDPDRSQTSDRVEFVETRNLATSNPDVAWRIMAAKHFAQDELKRQAGVGLGGRKNGKPVGHLYISWGQDEAQAQNLNRAEMVRSASGALRAIGAAHHQAIIVAHNDTTNPHCHVIINLIGDDGRLKSNWKEKEKLSKFALEREIEVHGEPVVKLREKNWKHRLAGEKTPTVKKKARHLWELDQAAQQDPKIAAFAKKHYQELAALERQRKGHINRHGKVVQEGLAQRHKRHRERLHWCFEERNRRIKADVKQKANQALRKIRQDHDFAWKNLLNEQEADRHEYRKNETTLLGKAYNVLRYSDWKKVFVEQCKTGDKSPTLFSRAFNALSSSGHRRGVIDRKQQQEQAELRQRQRRIEHTAIKKIKLERARKLEVSSAAYTRKSAAMKRHQIATNAKIQKEQQKLTQERNQVLGLYRERVKHQKRLRVAENVRLASSKQSDDERLSQIANRTFTATVQMGKHSGGSKAPLKAAENTAATKPKRTRKRKHPSERTNRRRTKSANLLPKEDSNQAAEQIDQHLKNIAECLRKHNQQNRGNTRGGGRKR